MSWHPGVNDVTTWGADADALDLLAQQLDGHARELEQIYRSLGAQLHAAPWRGPAADRFRSEWSTVHARAFTQLTGFLRQAAKVIHANASEQRAASAAGAGLGGGAHGVRPTTPPPYGSKEYWQHRALERAGIGAWDPSRGFDANRDTIAKVYEYYASLYKGHPELAWAAMAALIGPSFIAGFADLDMFKNMADKIGDRIDGIEPLPSGLAEMRDSMRAVSEMGEDDVAFFEQKLLGMQKEIFLDQATMHTAYDEGGIDAVRALLRSGQVADPGGATLRAWELIDTGRRTGDQAMISDGNLGLLRREQNLIITDDYDEMYHYKPPLGMAVTYMMTLAGKPSIPGARSFAEVFPWTVGMEAEGGVHIPGTDIDVGGSVGVSVKTPLPDGNVAIQSDRWALISKDTRPAFLDLYQNHPDRLQDLLSQSPMSRADDYRIANTFPDLIKHLLTDWDVEARGGLGIKT